MQLFNIDHEHWEDVATSNATLPVDALAYEVESGKWVTTESELDSASHLGHGTLRYTARGLDLLRKNGYEG